MILGLCLWAAHLGLAFERSNPLKFLIFGLVIVLSQGSGLSQKEFGAKKLAEEKTLNNIS